MLKLVRILDASTESADMFLIRMWRRSRQQVENASLLHYNGK